MKQKKSVEVPDCIFEALGFALPKDVPGDYQKGDSVTDYVGSGRVLSLKRECMYQKTYPVMKRVGLLNLNYPHLPDESYQQADYVLQVISRYIKGVLMSFRSDTAGQEDEINRSLAFIQSILEPYKNELEVCHVGFRSGYQAEIACRTFQLPFCYCIRLGCMDGATVYGAVGMKRKRKEGYYAGTSKYHTMKARLSGHLKIIVYAAERGLNA